MFSGFQRSKSAFLKFWTPFRYLILVGLGLAFGLSATLSQAQTQGFEDEYALANPLAINVKPVSQTGQAQKKVEPLLPGQAIKMEGGGEVRIYSEDGRIQITSQEGSVVLFDGMVKVESKPWLEDRPVLVREAQAGTETKLVPQFRINVGQADVEVVPGQEMRLAGPLIISAVRGTKFSMSVSDDGSSFLNVLEGKVLSMARDGQVELLDAGKKASLTATKFTNFLRNLNVKIPVGGDWRSVDRQVLDQAVSQAFGDSFDFLGGAMEKAKGAKDDISAKMAELTSRVVESPAVASDAPRKNMVAKP